jgi:hypothetical protein
MEHLSPAGLEGSLRRLGAEHIGDRYPDMSVIGRQP